MSRRRVLVTGLFSQAGVFAVRRFGELGFEVTAADNHLLAPGLYSRFVSKRVRLPRMRRDPRGFAEGVLAELGNGAYDYYFPAFEEALVMSAWRDEVLARTRCVLPERELALSLHDKSRMGAVAAAAGLRTPETFAPDTLDEAEEIARRIDFPVCVKKRITTNSSGLRRVPDPADLPPVYREVASRHALGPGRLPLIQRLVSGREVSLAALAQEGSLVSAVAYEGTRWLPRSGGTTICRQTILHEAATRAARALAAHLGWTGFLSLDLVVEEPGGGVFVLDCNPRPSGGLHLAQRAGVEALSQWLEIADGEPAAPRLAYRTGVRTATFFAEFWWYLRTWFEGPEGWRERARLRRQWWSDRRRLSYDYQRRDDPWPGFALWIFLLLQFAKLPFVRREQPELFLLYNAYDDAVDTRLEAR